MVLVAEFREPAQAPDLSRRCTRHAAARLRHRRGAQMTRRTQVDWQLEDAMPGMVSLFDRPGSALCARQ